MKIIHIITAFGIGGAEKLLLNISNMQIENNEVHIIYFKNKTDLIPYLDDRIKVKRIAFSLSIIKQLKAYIVKIKPDIIHTHLGHADLLGIWSARNISAKIFCTIHSTYHKKNILDKIFFKLYSFLFLKIVKDAQVISISKSVENHVLNRLKIPKERSHLLANAIPFKKLKITIKPNKIVRLLFVGRLEKEKSVSTLLKAVSILKNENLRQGFILNIVGDGSLRKSLEKTARRLKINHLVSFKGFKKNIDIYYSLSDIFILPSLWEGFGIVILEAFKTKTVVIASNIEGPAELIQDNINGILFEKQNAKQLSEKILTLINDPEKRNMLANNAYGSFTQEYSMEVYIKKLNEIYQS